MSFLRTHLTYMRCTVSRLPFVGFKRGDMWLCGFHDSGTYSGDFKVRQVLEYFLMCEKPARYSLNHTLAVIHHNWR